MKILHVINSLYFGGAEKLITDSLPIYKNKGIDVELLVLKGNKTDFYKRLESAGVRIIYFKNQISLYNPLHILSIYKHLRKGNYNIIHVHLFPSLYWVAMAKAFINGGGILIYTEHNTKNKRRNNFVLKHLDRIIYKAYKAIIAISEGTAYNLRNHLNNPNIKIVVINNGINLNEVITSKPYESMDFGIPVNSKVIVQVSSFTSQKDQNTLIRAIVEMPTNIYLILVGDGPLRNDVEKLVADLGITQRVRFLGYRQDVPRILHSSDIVVLSSHYEGFGLAIVEGMAAKKPCIGSNVPGLSEVLQDAGLLFSPGNSEELKHIIMELIKNPDLYKKISEQCFNKSRMYSIESMAEKYVELYSKLTHS